ncbi:MAG: hypothetical protein FWD29_05300 [Micrococcales bacterium]|nr:hypothetical protein [Micrococcales bacterium]
MRPKLIRIWAAVAALAALPLAVLAAPPAHAAAGVAVSGVDGKAQAALDGPTTLQLSGSGFQSIQNGFGGIYVMFGTVTGSWRPSMGGVSGKDYLYVPDSQAKDNAGYEKFVAFPGSTTGDTANGGLLNANGTWSTTLVVPGPTFQTVNSSGQNVTVDCRTSQCGIITIGAHAVVNAANETFTPVSFGGGETSGGTGGTASPGASQAPEASAAPPVEVTLGVDPTTAVAGHALGFTARGFLPGEQVIAVFDDGLVTVGPLTAGRYGEVAGTVPLDPDLRVGSHVLRLEGASSGAKPEAEVTVRRDPALVSAEEAAKKAEAEAAQAEGLTPLETAIVAAAGALVVMVVFMLVAAGVRRSKARAERKRQQTGRSGTGPPASARKPAKSKAKVAPPALAANPEPPTAPAAPERTSVETRSAPTLPPARPAPPAPRPKYPPLTRVSGLDDTQEVPS